MLGSVGGIEAYVGRLSDSLVARGHQTDVAVADLTHADARESALRRNRILEAVRDFGSDCVLLHHVGDGQLLRMLQRSYLTVEFVHGFVCSGAKLFRRHDQVCKHSVGPRCLFDWYFGPCGTEPSPAAAINNLRRSRDYIRGLSVIDLIAVPSQFMRRYLIDEGLAADRIEVVDTAIGIPPAGLREGRATAAPHIVYVGRAVYAKGIQYLIRAVTLLDSRFRVTVVGDGWYLASLKALAADLGLGDRVTFPGIMQGVELRTLLRTATVAVVPSIWPDPAPLVVPEMRSLGLPVVVTDVGGLKEWADRYSDIFIADPADAASLAGAIRLAVEARVSPPASMGWPRPQNLAALLERLEAEHSARGRRAADVSAMAPATAALSAGSIRTRC